MTTESFSLLLLLLLLLSLNILLFGFWSKYCLPPLFLVLLLFPNDLTSNAVILPKMRKISNSLHRHRSFLIQTSLTNHLYRTVCSGSTLLIRAYSSGLGDLTHKALMMKVVIAECFYRCFWLSTDTTVTLNIYFKLCLYIQFIFALLLLALLLSNTL